MIQKGEASQETSPLPRPAGERAPWRAPSAPSRTRWLTAAAFLFAAVLLLARLGSLPLFSPDEDRNAEVAREMRASGAWLIPSFNGVPYLDKPAFYFRTVALSFDAFGVNETAARLPSALAALAVLAMVFAFCRKAYGTRGQNEPASAVSAGQNELASALPAGRNELAAALAVAVVASSPLFLALGRTVIFDMPLAVFVLASILSGALGAASGGAKRRAWWVLSAACAAVSTLIKGPVGFIVPGLVILAHEIARGEKMKALRLFYEPLDLLVFFGITISWFLAVAHVRPDFVHYGLVEETIKRYSTTAFHRTAPFYYYAPVLLGAFFPWSLLLPEAIVEAWKRRRAWRPGDRLFITCAVVVVAFFSTSQSKLPGYVLVAVIALGILVARIFANAIGDPRGPGARIVRRGSLLLAIVALVMAAFLARDLLSPGSLQRTFDIRMAEYARLRPAVASLLGTLAGMSVLAFLAWRTRRQALALAAFAAFSFALVTVDFSSVRAYAEAASWRSLARSAALSPETPVVALEIFPTGLPFYLRRPIILVTQDGHEMTSNYVVSLLRRSNEDGRPWPQGLVPVAEKDAWFDARSGPVYVISGKRNREELRRMANESGAEVREISPGIWGALIAPKTAGEAGDASGVGPAEAPASSAPAAGTKRN